MYVAKESEPGVWTVGFCEPGGKFVPESDHETKELAEDCARLLNGMGAVPQEEEV